MDLEHYLTQIIQRLDKILERFDVDLGESIKPMSDYETDLTPRSYPPYKFVDTGVEGWKPIPVCSVTHSGEHHWNDRPNMFPRKCLDCGYTDMGPPPHKLHEVELRPDGTGYEAFPRKKA